MPAYELSLVLRPLSRGDIAATLKRVGCLLIEKGVKIQKLENFGIDKELPYKTYVNNVYYNKGSYFIYSFTSSRKNFPEIRDECTRDVDVIRHVIAESYKDLQEGCTLDEEMRPPALRKSVQDLFEKSQKNKMRTKPFYWHVKEYNYYDDYM